MSNEIHLNHAKDNFRDRSSQEIDRGLLQKLFPEGRMIGIPQETGIAVVSNTPYGMFVEAAVKHPQHIFDGRSFGGLQTEKMIEYSLLRPVGTENAAQAAQLILDNASLPTMGAELEGYTYNSASGALVPAMKQIETVRGLREDPTPVCRSPEELAIARAQTILDRAHEEGLHGNAVIDTSTPLSLGGERPETSTGLSESDHPYIQAMCRIFENSYFVSSRYLDPRVQEVLNEYAVRYGYSDIDGMLGDLGVSKVWDIAASHVSFGVPGDPPPMELGIAVANLFSSDLATAAEFLTQSTPLHAGEPVWIHNGTNNTPVRDVRTFTRYFLRTAYVSDPFIEGTQQLSERILDGVVSGTATTPDRAAFPNIGPDGKPFVSAHARVRLRGYGDPNIPTARVEFVGGSSTPSVYDVLARDAYLTVLWTAALEAVAHHQTPQEYYSDLGFPSAGNWHQQMELSLSYATSGIGDDNASRLVSENVRFLSRMGTVYPHLRPYTTYATARLLNLGLQASASSVSEYTGQPTGSLSEVIVRMKQSGYADAEILRQLNDHQIQTSETILRSGGDYDMLFRSVFSG